MGGHKFKRTCEPAGADKGSGIKQTIGTLPQGKIFEAELDERIVFDQLDDSASTMWSLLFATGCLKVLEPKYVGKRKRKVYTLAPANREAESIFKNMVKGWFGGNKPSEQTKFMSHGFALGKIRSYGFAFQGKEGLIG